MILIKYNNQPSREVKFTTFSGGEEHIQLNDFEKDVYSLEILASIRSSSDIMRLALLNDALLYKYPKVEQHLYMPYVLLENCGRKQEKEGALRTIFCNGKIYNETSLSEIRLRTSYV